MDFLVNVNDKVVGLLADLSVWATCCVQLRRATSLRKLMAIMLKVDRARSVALQCSVDDTAAIEQIGNFVNFGSSRGGAMGIRVGTLLKASQMRSANPASRTMLHLLARFSKVADDSSLRRAYSQVASAVGPWHERLAAQGRAQHRG
jgi:hypothetical protein